MTKKQSLLMGLLSVAFLIEVVGKMTDDKNYAGHGISIALIVVVILISGREYLKKSN